MDGHTLWYWVARGARRADSAYVMRVQGLVQNHIHDSRSHWGRFNWPWEGEAPRSSTSAANYADIEFEKAKDFWLDRDKARAMYHLGMALHLVQDLRVPQHNSNLWPNHHEYEADVKHHQVALGVYSSGIYRDSFKAIGNHQKPDSAYGWVDRSAHVSSRWYYGPFSGPVVEQTRFFESAPLVHSAQRFSAGFLQFFFGEVNKIPFRPRLSLWTGTYPNEVRIEEVNSHNYVLRKRIAPGAPSYEDALAIYGQRVIGPTQLNNDGIDYYRLELSVHNKLLHTDQYVQIGSWERSPIALKGILVQEIKPGSNLSATNLYKVATSMTNPNGHSMLSSSWTWSVGKDKQRAWTASQ